MESGKRHKNKFFNSTLQLHTETYFETNSYGFSQKRLAYERDITVPLLSPELQMEFAHILNSGADYGRVTQFVALDSEYDACRETNLKIPCKISIVNEEGKIILDTLINQEDEEGN